jgi:hypothetical protein
MTEAIYPVILHQDPRYFRRGTGSVWSRLASAAGQIFWTHTDSDHTQFNFSEIIGNSTAVAISTAYYPDNRTATDAVSKLMEHVEGKTLGALIGHKGLKLSEALKYAVQIADALAKAHAAFQYAWYCFPAARCPELAVIQAIRCILVQAWQPKWTRLVGICPYETKSSFNTIRLHPSHARGWHLLYRRRGLRPCFQHLQHLRGSWRLHPGLYRRDTGAITTSTSDKCGRLYECVGTQHRRMDFE